MNELNESVRSLWTLRIGSILGILAAIAAGWAACFIQVAASSSLTLPYVDAAASGIAPLLPRGVVDWAKLNPRGVRSDIMPTSAIVSNLDGSPMRDASGEVSILNELLLCASGRPVIEVVLWHLAVCVAALVLVGSLMRPRLVSMQPESRCYWLRLLWPVYFLTALPASLFLASYHPAWLFWSTAWFLSDGYAWIDVWHIGHLGPLLGAIGGYFLLVLWAAQLVVVWRARRAGRELSHGRLPESGRCLACGYACRELRPCPECGAPDPTAIPEGLHFGPWHAKLRLSRFGWLIPTSMAALVLSLYCAPLIAGCVRAVWLLLKG